MSTTAVRKGTEATHMHVTYFSEARPTAIVPRDLADAFRQLERLLEFAVLLTRPESLEPELYRAPDHDYAEFRG